MHTYTVVTKQMSENSYDPPPYGSLDEFIQSIGDCIFWVKGKAELRAIMSQL